MLVVAFETAGVDDVVFVKPNTAFTAGVTVTVNVERRDRAARERQRHRDICRAADRCSNGTGVKQTHRRDGRCVARLIVGRIGVAAARNRRAVLHARRRIVRHGHRHFAIAG